MHLALCAAGRSDIVTRGRIIAGNSLDSRHYVLAPFRNAISEEIQCISDDWATLNPYGIPDTDL